MQESTESRDLIMTPLTQRLIDLTSSIGDQMSDDIDEAIKTEVIQLLDSPSDAINIHAENDRAFYWACENGYADLVRKIISLEHSHGKINLSDEGQEAFSWACMDGEQEIAELILSLNGEIDIHAKGESAFCGACENHELETAKWLFSIDRKIDFHIHNDSVFKRVCEDSSIKLAEWLLSLEKSDEKISASNKENAILFRACNEGHLFVADWLLLLPSNDYDSFSLLMDHGFYHASEAGRSSVARLLCHLAELQQANIQSQRIHHPQTQEFLKNFKCFFQRCHTKRLYT